MLALAMSSSEACSVQFWRCVINICPLKVALFVLTSGTCRRIFEASPWVLTSVVPIMHTYTMPIKQWTVWKACSCHCEKMWYLNILNKLAADSCGRSHFIAAPYCLPHVVIFMFYIIIFKIKFYMKAVYFWRLKVLDSLSYLKRFHC